MRVRLLHAQKAPLSIVVSPCGSVMSVRNVHEENAPTPMVVRHSGKVMLVSLWQSRNIKRGSSDTLARTTADFKIVQPSNAQLPILVTLSGMVTLIKEVQSENALLPMLVTAMPSIFDGISAAVTELSQSTTVFASLLK